MDHLNFMMLGLGNGAVFGALALALAVTYRSSGVLNFATSSLAIYGAYTYSFLRNGYLYNPIPGIKSKIDIGDGLGMWPALIVSVLISALVGVILYVAIFRNMRTASPTAKAVGSIGVMVLMSGLMMRSVKENDIQAVKAIFPEDTWTLGSLRINSDRFYLVLTIVAVAVVLATVFRFTRFGLATRASAETEVGAVVSGLKPERIAIINWAISGAVSGLAGILIAPLTPLQPGIYTLFIVPALAAAVLGRFTALTPAVLGGIAIGMLQAEAQFLGFKWPWTLSSGNSELVPLILVLVVLLVNSKPLPTRGTLMEKSLGKSPRPYSVLLPTVVFSLVGAIALMVTDGNTRGSIAVSMIMAMIALSQVVVTGFAGQLSLAQLTLAGAGGFALSHLTEGLGVPFPIAPILAGVVAMVIGVVVGLPALRIRGLLVGIVTFTLAVVLESGWFRNMDFNNNDGGTGSPIKDAKFFGIDLSVGTGLTYPKLAFCLMVLVTLVLVGVGVAWLRNSRLGAAMLAVRANEKSAAAAGISVVQVKIIAFAIGSFIAGLGGSMLAYKQSIVTFDTYSAIAGLGVLAVVYIGGITSIYGGIAAGLLAQGGFIFTLIDKSFSITQWFGIISGLGLIFNVISNPEGVVAPTHKFLEKRRLKKIAESEVSVVRASGTSANAFGVRGPIIAEVSGLSVRYGGVSAVTDVSFNVHSGLITGLIGPNGAGKTTTMDAISGFARYTGRVTLDGKELDGLAPHQRVAAGLGRTFQGVDLYEDLTVAENIAVSQQVTGESVAEAEASLAQLLDMLGLTAKRNRGVAELSQGERQLVSIARALACKPKLLLLDEPAAGLDSAESLWLADRLREIRDTGVTILIVDHDMGLVLSLCDEIFVLDFGRLIATGSPAEIRSNPQVASAYLGASVEGI
jgi:ABC-type branched-subunit amino acid transport system ATPase component/ABC-type branched-subunit amino acid transport system permease subunit